MAALISSECSSQLINPLSNEKAAGNTWDAETYNLIKPQMMKLWFLSNFFPKCFNQEFKKAQNEILCIKTTNKFDHRHILLKVLNIKFFSMLGF